MLNSRLATVDTPVETGPGCSRVRVEPPPSEIARFGHQDELVLKLATTEEDREKAWNLVYREYLAKGYTEPQLPALRYTLHDALPDTGTFLIESQGLPVGTISVFPDSPLGLPADDIYNSEIDELRDANRTPVEIGRLAIVPAFAKDRKVLMQLVEISCLYARRVIKASDLIITVNPAHQSFYGRIMRLKTLGQDKMLGSVCGAPAVLMWIDLGYQERLIGWANGERPSPDGQEARQSAYRVYRSFRGRAREDEVVNRIRQRQRPLSAEFLRKYFVRKRPLLPALRSQLKYFLSKCYPDYDMPAA